MSDGKVEVGERLMLRVMSVDRIRKRAVCFNAFMGVDGRTVGRKDESHSEVGGRPLEVKCAITSWFIAAEDIFFRDRKRLVDEYFATFRSRVWSCLQCGNACKVDVVHRSSKRGGI